MEIENFNQVQEEKRNEKYNEYVKKVTPTHNLWLNMLKAFVLGGGICLLGQFIQNIFMKVLQVPKEDAGLYSSILLILFSILLTSLNIYPSLAKWGGAGALVPITGFANGICSSAIEYKKEGQVFGIGCQIFKIAGPVILYGIFSSFCLGTVYWIMQALFK